MNVNNKEKEFSNNIDKKLRIFTILLNIGIVIIIIILLAFYYFDEIKIHSDMMINSNESEILIKDKNDIFSDLDIREFFNYIGNREIDYNKNIQFDSSKINFVGYASNNLKFPYYDDTNEIVPVFRLYNSKQMQSLNVIGELPKENNEVLISKILADNIIEKGVYIIEKDEIVPFKFFSYEELINSKAKIYFNDTYLIISGIIDDDFTKFDVLKTNSLDSEELKELYEEFEYYNNNKNIFIVMEDFFENLKYNDYLKADFTNYNIKPDLYYYDINLDNIKYYKNLDIYVNDSFVTELELQNNELVIDLFTLDLLTEHNFTKEYNLWRKKNINDYDSFKLFLKKYINDNKILDNTLDLIIKGDNLERDMHIVGVILNNYSYLEEYDGGVDIITLSSPVILLNENIFNEYSSYHSQFPSVYLSLNISNKNELKDLFKKLEKSEQYDYETKYKKVVKDIVDTIGTVKLILYVVLSVIILVKLIIAFYKKRKI